MRVSCTRSCPAHTSERTDDLFPLTPAGEAKAELDGFTTPLAVRLALRFRYGVSTDMGLPDTRETVSLSGVGPRCDSGFGVTGTRVFRSETSTDDALEKFALLSALLDPARLMGDCVGALEGAFDMGRSGVRTISRAIGRESGGRTLLWLSTSELGGDRG